jgi:hypothetical protein
MRKLLLVLATAPVLFAQPVSVGIKAGVPFTDAFETLSNPGPSLRSETKRYTVGPTFELHLPARFSIEVDALYKRFNFSSTQAIANSISGSIGDASSWEFPLLVKYRFKGGLVRPYVDTGVSFTTLRGLTELRQFFSRNGLPDPVDDRFRAGFVLGGGLELKLAFLRISPEIRYTRWGWNNFRDVGSVLHSRDNQAEFLLGVTF